MSIIAGVGSPGSVGPTSGGKIYPYNNISTTPQIVVQANQNRQALTFHNPGSVNIYIFPQYAQGNGTAAPTTPSNVALTPTTSALGGGFLVSANGGTVNLTGECQGAWQALAASGTTNPLTVMESNN